MARKTQLSLAHSVLTLLAALAAAGCGGGGAANPPPGPPPGADATAPAVALTSPAPGSTASGNVTVSATATDNVAVAGVQFLLDGAPLGAEDLNSPYSTTWNSAGAGNGSHTLSARARDTAGNQTTSAPVTVTASNPPPADGTAPAVAMSAPSGGANVSGTVSLSATATDNVGVIGVQFLLDGAPLGVELLAAPFSVAWNTTTTANGQHTLAARARDAAGNQTTSGAVSVTAGNAGPGAASATFTLQPAQRFQTWESWQGVATGPVFLDAGGVNRLAPPAVLSHALDDLAFDLGINTLRVLMPRDPEPVNDNADAFSINAAGFDFTTPFVVSGGQRIDWVERMNQIVLPMKQRVESRGEAFFSYVTQGYTAGTLPAHWQDPEEYAEAAEAYVAHTRSVFNWTPTYWVIMNEPSTRGFTASEIAGWIDATGRRFAQRGFNIKMQTAETADADPAYLQSVLSSPAAAAFVRMVSFHGYDYMKGFLPPPAALSARNNLRTLASGLNGGVPTGMTEVHVQGWDGSYAAQGLEMVRDIYWSMTEADVSAWQHFGLINPCGALGCPNGGSNYINLDADLQSYFKFPAYYALRQYSRYIRPGHVRVGLACAGCTTGGGGVGSAQKAVAFQSAAGKYVAVVLNDDLAAATFSLAGFPAGTYDITGVDPANTAAMVFAPVTIGAGQSLTLSFPSRAIFTFVQR